MSESALAPKAAKLLYTGKTSTTGGRDHGIARSSDGSLDIKLSPPGSGKPGTNPEQLLAAGWSACFEGAIGLAALHQRVKLPAEPTINAEVDLNHGTAEDYFLRARLNVSLPGLERAVAQKLVDEAHATCPYSKALRQGIDIAINLV